MPEKPTLDWYLDRARTRAKCASDHDLGALLKLSRGAISQYRTARAWPADEVMEQIAEIAGEDRHLAVVRLHSWKEPNVTTWREMIEKMTRVAAAVLITVFAVSFFKSSEALARPGQLAGGSIGEVTRHASSTFYTLCDISIKTTL